MLSIILFVTLLSALGTSVESHIVPKPCHKPCKKIYNPICAFPVKFGGEPKTFGNTCELYNYNCDHNPKYVFSYWGECKKNCKDVCIALHDPLCAKPVGFPGPAIEFGNTCELERYNCHHPRRQYKLSNKGECQHQHHHHHQYKKHH